MRKFIASLCLALLFVMPTSARSPWQHAIQKAETSVVFLGNAEEFCSGFVINKDKHTVLTAAHCDMEDGSVPAVDGSPATRLLKDMDLDIMVLSAPDVKKPSLHLAKKDAKQWEQILHTGYEADKLLRVATATVLSSNHTDNVFSKPMLITNNIIIPGQSGGPALNADGDVVGLQQMLSPGLFISASLPASRIAEATKGFWDK